MEAPSRSEAQLETRIRPLLERAERHFKGKPPLLAINFLKELPMLIGDWQYYLGFEKRVRKPFWRCVAALDRKRPELRLIETLTKMVDHAVESVPEGPLVRLSRQSNMSPLTQPEQAALQRLVAELDDYPLTLPSNDEAYLSLFRRINSERFKAGRAEFSDVLTAKKRAFLAYTAYLDFFHQHRRWRDLYFTGLHSLLYDVLWPIEATELIAKLQKVFIFDLPTPKKIGARALRDRKRREKRNERVRGAGSQSA